MKQTGTSSLMDGNMVKFENTNPLSNQSSISSHFEISDKVLFEQATVAMEEHYGYGCETEIDGYFRGAKWMQKNMYTEEQMELCWIAAMSNRAGFSDSISYKEFIKSLKQK
jgi:hypothetical protein